MSELDLDAIEARAKAATPGPWEYDGCSVTDWGVTASHTITMEWMPNGRGDGTNERESPDGQFIAHAREDVPALIAELRRLREENARLKDRIGKREDAFLIGAPHEAPAECPSYYDKCNCTVENLAGLIDIADKLREEARWIPVTERLPESAGKYMTFSGTYGVCQLWFEGRVFDDCGDTIRDVTHWRPLPKPPEVKP